MSQTTPPTTPAPTTPTPGNQGNGASQPVPIQPALIQQVSSPRIPYWLQQAERFLRAIVRIYIGLIVAVVPWLPTFWDNNPLFASSPTLMGWITNGAVRGLISGLGLLNLWIALRDAIRSPNDPHAQ